MRHVVKKDTDRGHSHFLKSTCEMGINQRHVTWAFLKFDTVNRFPPSRPPVSFDTETGFSSGEVDNLATGTTTL